MNNTNTKEQNELIEETKFKINKLCYILLLFEDVGYYDYTLILDKLQLVTDKRPPQEVIDLVNWDLRGDGLEEIIPDENGTIEI